MKKFKIIVKQNKNQFVEYLKTINDFLDGIFLFLLII
jgi:hypothetical protein